MTIALMPSNAAQEDMIDFPGGIFEMGSDDGAAAERPRHLHRVAPFSLDRHLVTNADFRAFADETGHITDCERRGRGLGFSDGRYQEIEGLSWRSYASPERERHPVVLVSWSDASQFASWCDKRLPSEAEWECAARSAAGGANFPWGGGEPSDCCGAGTAWHNGPGTSPVGAYASNNGVFDLVGNVWQWCADVYESEAYANYVKGEAGVRREAPFSTGELRARRGGAWNVLQAFRLRCSNRGAYESQAAAPNLGFRCARSRP
jgi:formylglycine-generating enzyme required for sulfatase activity